MNTFRLRRHLQVLAVALVLVTALSLVALAAPNLVIMHTNDVHGRLEAFKPRGADSPLGGVDHLATVVKQLRGEHPEATLLLDGGDFIHGTNVVNVFSGKAAIEVMNTLGYDAMVLGNHEFNYGWQTLKQVLTEANFDALTSNVIEEATGEPLGVSARITTVNGVKVGLFGLTAPETPIVTHPKNVVGVRFLDPVERAKSVATYLDKNVDLVVALSHLGYSEDQELAKAVPAIDVIVGGHSHTELAQATKIGDTIIVQAGEHARNLGVLKLTVEGGKVTAYESQLIPITNDVPQDPEIAAIVASWNQKLTEQMEVVVGETTVALDGERANVRTRETNLGSLIVDIMREAAEADVAITNGGGIRASINEGPITIGEIYTVLPFDNTLVKLELTGAQLKAALEHGVSKYPAQNGGFLQVSGLTFTFDPNKEAGGRVVGILVGGKPLDPAATYTVATNDFMAAGGDGYAMLKEGKVLVDTGEMLRDTVAKYVAAKKTIAPQVEGRIQTLQ